MSCVLKEDTIKQQNFSNHKMTTILQPINPSLIKETKMSIQETITNRKHTKVKHFDEENFDTLGQGYNLYQCAIAGSVAGICEHSILFPFDAIKTNQQSMNNTPINQFKFVDSMRYYFAKRAWRGISTNMTGVALAHAVQFPVIEGTCNYIESLRSDKNSKFYNSPVINASFIAGMVGSVPHDLIMNPFSVIKQRLQLSDSPHKTARECYHSNSCRALYASFPAQLSCTAAYHGTYYYFYNDFLRTKFDNTFPEYKNGVGSFIFRSVVASSIAVLATQHADAIVTRVNTQKCITCPDGMRGLINSKITIRHAALDVWREGLIASGRRGLGMRMCCLLPANLITWGAYELIKLALKKNYKT